MESHDALLRDGVDTESFSTEVFHSHSVTLQTFHLWFFPLSALVSSGSSGFLPPP